MKKRFFLQIRTLQYSLLAFIIFTSSSITADTYSLEQCFQKSLEKSKTLQAQDERIKQAEARIASAKAVSNPTLSLDSNLLYQDAPESAQAKTFFPSNQTTSKIQLSIPLFKGFRDITNVAQKQKEKAAQHSMYEAAKQTLYDNIAELYFTILALEQDIALYTKEIQANEKRLKELQSLKRLARARETDCVTVESAIASLEASKEMTVGQLNTARDTLSFLTDLDSNATLQDDTSKIPTPQSSSEWKTELNNLPTIQEAQYAVDAAKANLSIAKGEYYPVATFTTNYYVARPGIFSDITWDMGIVLSIPLLSKKTVDPKIKDAESKLKEKELQLESLKESQEHLIQTTLIQLQTYAQQLSKFEKALNLANERYRLLSQDNLQGLATNLDVLQANAAVYQTQRLKDHTKIMMNYTYKKLEIISGRRK